MQEYVEKKHGLKVHTAYIAEVRRSWGLTMYDAPNAVEEFIEAYGEMWEDKDRYSAQFS